MPDVVLSATIGAPALLSACIARIPAPPALITVDAVDAPTSEQLFFRAPAQLVLPSWQAARVVAATAIVRPGGQSYELVCSDTFRWPEDSHDALKALERIVLAHVDQWRSPRALWTAPAEILLPEVNDRSPSDAGNAR